MNADVIVIGAGIMGAACAHALAACGLHVIVVDAGGVNATAQGMGHLVVMDDNQAQFELSSTSAAIWRQWSEVMPKDCTYVASGTLWIASSDAEMASAQKKATRLRDRGIDSRLLTGAELESQAPSLRTGLAGGLLVPSDSIVYAPNAARWLLQTSGTRVKQVCDTVIEMGDGLVSLRSGGQLRADAVLVAVGLHTASLCSELPIRAKKGHLVITDRYPGVVQHQMIELGYIGNAHRTEGDTVSFNVQPRPTGQLLIGSSRQFNTTDPVVETQLVARMLSHAAEFMPGLADLNVIRTWTGFRASTPDNLPLIGRHPNRSKTWLAVGHEGLGVTNAPATAALLAAQITGAGLPFSATPYDPSRLLQASEKAIVEAGRLIPSQ